MGQSYRLLGEGLPVASPQAGAVFAADARKTRAWVAALPRANALATQQSLARALESLHSQRLDGAQRQAVLEELRPAIGESIGLLKRDYAGSTLPLSPAKASAAAQAEGFHLMLAHGYRKAAVEFCAPSGNIPMLRSGSVALAVARASWHYSQALAVAWRVYRAPGAGVWQGLHRVHAFAVEHRLDIRPMEDALAGSSVEVRKVYLQALLMAVTHPLAFSQGEQDILWQITGDYASRCALLHAAPPENAPVVPDDADRGPGPPAVGEKQTAWLQMEPFCAEVLAAVGRQRDGFSSLMPARGSGFKVSVEMLTRLQRSFGQASARTHVRLPATHAMRTVFGLSGVHFYLAGERDFDAFIRQAMQNAPPTVNRAAWAATRTDAVRVPVHDARVLDQSLGGYRLAWDHAQQIRARVGEVVGLSLAAADEEPEWMLGVVRWLRYEDNDGLSAGVELLSRRTLAVGLRVHGGNGGAQAPVRAVEMEGLERGDDMNFLAQNALDSAATRVEVVRDESAGGFAAKAGLEDLLAGVDVLLNAGDYALLRPLRPDLVLEADAGAAQ